jgi:hypothetical protein
LFRTLVPRVYRPLAHRDSDKLFRNIAINYERFHLPGQSSFSDNIQTYIRNATSSEDFEGGVFYFILKEVPPRFTRIDSK